MSLQVRQIMTSNSSIRDTRLHFEEASEATSPSASDTRNDLDDEPTSCRSTLTILDGERPGVLDDEWKGIAPQALAG